MIARTSAGKLLLLDSTGPLLTSALSDLPCEQAAVEFGPGDSILFYTDGVTEASSAAGMFGMDRLVSLMTAGDRRGSALLDEILRQMAAFTGSSSYQDDVTLLTLDFEQNSPLGDNRDRSSA